MKHSLKDWIIATRPWSFTASAMPVIVTAAWMAANDRDVCWWLAALTVVNIILVHAAGNTWSDYHDYVKGVDTADTYGAKTITTGLFTANEIRHLSEILNIAAIAMGIAMVAMTGLPLLWIGYSYHFMLLHTPYARNVVHHYRHLVLGLTVDGTACRTYHRRHPAL